MARRSAGTKHGLEQALQKLVRSGEWDRARVERFKARVRDVLRERKDPKSAKGAADDTKPGRRTRKLDE